MTYRSEPQREGYRLTEEGENLYSDWLDMGGCCCHTGCAPCSTCIFEGHPISLEETDEVWEPEFTEYLIDYTDEYGLPTCAIGCAAGSGFCTETCQHFEKVEKCGAGLERIYCKFIEETEGGGMARDKIVNKSNVKDPPEFKVGDKVKYLGGVGGFEDSTFFTKGKEYQVLGLANFNVRPLITLTDDYGNSCNIVEDVFSLVSSQIAIQDKQCNSINQQEESKMSNANNRRVLTVQVFDLDPALDVELSLVHVFKDVVTEDTNEVTLTELLHTGQLVEPLVEHNKKRTAQDNKDILSRTGKKVKLEPAKIKNLSFKYV
jgi:hypothetical protein